MEKTLKDIASVIDGKIVGDDTVVIKGVCGIKEAQEGDITFLANTKYKHFLDKTHAAAIIVTKDIEYPAKTIIQTENPSLGFSKVISMFKSAEAKHSKGIDKKSSIHKAAKISDNVSIGAFSVIDEDASLEDGVIIYPNCYIGKNVKIDKDTLIYPNVTIRENVTIGKNVIIHSSTIIGSDGFGYIEIDGVHKKIPQVGVVIIEDDVEIGANVAIDRARFGQTVIGKGTKIDNLVQIAHNVKIGANSIIVAQVGIAGSVTIGKNNIVAGQTALTGHVELGDNVMVGGRSAVTKSFPSNSILLGAPAKHYRDQKKIFACISKLPELFNTIKKIKKKLNIDDGKTENNKSAS